MPTKIKLGISSCLLGEKVRFDGGHRWDRFITENLGKFVEFVPVCPEVECGLGVPREAMHLVASPEGPRLLTVRTQVDHTERLLAWARKRVVELEQEDLGGFIFKSDSPSSGMERVKIYSGKGGAAKTGVGLFAREFMQHFPWLPVEEEGRLHDPGLRENFLERLFSLKRWRDTLALGPKPGHLVDFHTRHKLLIMSHSPKHYVLLGKLVAQVKTIPLPEIYKQYQTQLMEALRLKATIKKNTNVLLHVLGYFKKNLAPAEKEELLEIIDEYRQAYLPLIVPVTLLNHYVRKYDQAYLQDQYYLASHPLELKLRHQV
ncbi:MAG: YbgA family protein [Desulfobaccales bacterium]